MAKEDAKKEPKKKITKKTAIKDLALEEVLSEQSAGATEDVMDIESPIGEDAEVIADAEKKEESEDSPELPQSPEKPADEEEKAIDSRARVRDQRAQQNDKKVKTAKKEHIQGPRKPIHGKKYLNAIKDVDLKTAYKKEDAIELVKRTAYAKFDGTVEAHIKLSVSNLRGLVHLPAGTGKERKVAVVTPATIDDFLKAVEAGKLDFDVAVATPDVMAKLSKVAKVLGPRGLMPNPKSGTVTPDVEKAKEELSSGKVEYKQDKGGVVHQAIGKVSFETEKLVANLNALLSALPGGKITSVVVTSTMGPGIRVQL